MVVRLFFFLLMLPLFFRGQSEQKLFPEVVLNSKTPWKGNNAFLEEFLVDLNYDKTYENIFRVPIQFWVYKTNGLTAQKAFQRVQHWVQRLNYYFRNNKCLIEFYALPELNLVAENRHQVIRWDGESSWVMFRYRKSGVLNVHIVDGIVRKRYYWFGDETSSYYGLYNSFARAIILRNNAPASTLAHEVGHFLGLEHTHYNSDKGHWLQESVNRNQAVSWKKKLVKNCEVRGDLLCDTPADPKLTGKTTADCRYVGRDVDAWGWEYSPDTHNLMSYPTSRSCRENFTRSQVAVMLYTAWRYYREELINVEWNLPLLEAKHTKKQEQ